MSLPFLNTAPGYDEELRNSVFFERGLHATSICGAVGAAVAVAMLQARNSRPASRSTAAAPATPVRRGAGEEIPRQRREVPPGGARGPNACLSRRSARRGSHRAADLGGER